MRYYYPEVSGLGNVAVSRHAQLAVSSGEMSSKEFEDALLTPTREVREGFDIIWREKAGIRLVILTKPIPFKGAVLVKTAYRLREIEKIK